MSIEAEGTQPIVLDMGTGIRYFGEKFCGEQFRGAALVTHLHWDHVQGVPFFQPLLEKGNELDIYAPAQEDGSSLQDAFGRIICPPAFPVTLDLFSGTFRFHELGNASFDIGKVRVTSRLVPHIGPTLGYRLECGGSSIAYISDHQQPYDGSFEVPDAVMELAEGVDLLIHDSQYTPAEFEKRYYFGHCTQDFAVGVAMKSRAKRLALFHHDPVRTDDELDAVSACAVTGLDVFAAREGLVVRV